MHSFFNGKEEENELNPLLSEVNTSIPLKDPETSRFLENTVFSRGSPGL